MWIFQHDGECGFSGIWTTITSARSFDKMLIQPPREATHWVRYITGTDYLLSPGEKVTGGTSAATARVVAQIIEQGTIGADTAAGTLLLRSVDGTFQAETLTGAESTGTAVIGGPLSEVVSHSPAKMVLITVETATIQFSYSGQTVTITGGTNEGMQLVSGANLTIRGPGNVKKFQAINAGAANGAIMKYALHF